MGAEPVGVGEGVVVQAALLSGAEAEAPLLAAGGAAQELVAVARVGPPAAALLQRLVVVL